MTTKRKARYIVEVHTADRCCLKYSNLITKTTDTLKKTTTWEEWSVCGENCATGANITYGYGHTLSGMAGRAKPDNRMQVISNVRKVLHTLLANPSAKLTLACDAEIITR